MRKLIRSIQFDQTDLRVFDRAAEAGEWAVSGAFAFAHLPPETVTGKVRQAFANGFLGLGSFGRTTFVTVGEITDAAWQACEDQLVRHFIDVYGAPDDAAARAEARAELAFAADLAAGQPINTVLTVRRLQDAQGVIREEFRTITPPTGEARHARVWSIETDG